MEINEKTNLTVRLRTKSNLDIDNDFVMKNYTVDSSKIVDETMDGYYLLKNTDYLINLIKSLCGINGHVYPNLIPQNDAQTIIIDYYCKVEDLRKVKIKEVLGS